MVKATAVNTLPPCGITEASPLTKLLQFGNKNTLFLITSSQYKSPPLMMLVKSFYYEAEKLGSVRFSPAITPDTAESNYDETVK